MYHSNKINKKVYNKIKIYIHTQFKKHSISSTSLHKDLNCDPKVLLADMTTIQRNNITALQSTIIILHKNIKVPLVCSHRR